MKGNFGSFEKQADVKPVEMPNNTEVRPNVPSEKQLLTNLKDLFRGENPRNESSVPNDSPPVTRHEVQTTLPDGTKITLPKTIQHSHSEVASTKGDCKESNADISEKKGGSYKDVKVDGEGDKYEVHHMPADSASHLDRGDGPAIKMEKEDHRQTASCGMSREAREYRETQKELIDQGEFKKALQMDIDDVREKFGTKYDDAIEEMNEYVKQLEEGGKI